MFLKRLSVFLLAGSMASSLLAVESKPQPPKSGEERPDDMICTFETPMGSHIKRKVCVTRQQREEQQKSSQDAMQGGKRRSSARPNAEPRPNL